MSPVILLFCKSRDKDGSISHKVLTEKPNLQILFSPQRPSQQGLTLGWNPANPSDRPLDQSDPVGTAPAEGPGWGRGCSCAIPLSLGYDFLISRTERLLKLPKSHHKIGGPCAALVMLSELLQTKGGGGERLGFK